MMGIHDDKGKKKPEAGCGWNAKARAFQRKDVTPFSILIWGYLSLTRVLYSLKAVYERYEGLLIHIKY
jgi:hypothetical protein